MAIALTGTELKGAFWGEVKLAHELGRKGKRRPHVWAKCPECDGGKWVRKDTLKPDGITSKTICDSCNFGFDLVRTAEGNSQTPRVSRWCPACETDKPVAQGYPKDRYRLLCYNCNCAIGARGYCPHKPPPGEVS